MAGELSDNKSPFDHIVPKDYQANLRWRRQVLIAARHDLEMQRDLWRMCARDPLFYVNTFVYAYDPRLKGHRITPFITFDYQDEAIWAYINAIGLGDGEAEDIITEKSRDMGASWTVLIVFDWAWRFHSDMSFLAVSRNERLVDASTNTDSLFWKLRLIQKMLPNWLTCNVVDNKLRLYNPETSSVIDGTATTGDIGRGGRRTAILLDEFAAFDGERPGSGAQVLSATADAANCRIFNSTPKGTANAFYQLVQSDVKRLRFHWSHHPNKAAGLYKATAENVDILDDDYEFPEGYQYVRDGKLRSVWYDRECKRRVSKKEIAQELDIDYLASGEQFYDEDALVLMERNHRRAPVYEGAETIKMLESAATGRLHVERKPHMRVELNLWCIVDPRTGPSHDTNYAIGCDVSAGSDASNSVATVADVRTGEKVAELTLTNVLPHDFAKYVAALGRWFGGERSAENGGGQCESTIIWEENGPGRIFGRTLQDINYHALYRRKPAGGSRKPLSECPIGWFAGADANDTLHGEYRRALATESLINHSRRAINQCRKYVYLPNGHVGYSGVGEEERTSGAHANHGDHVVADALCWKLVHESQPTVEDNSEPVVPPGSFMARRLARRAKEREQRFW